MMQPAIPMNPSPKGNTYVQHAAPVRHGSFRGGIAHIIERLLCTQLLIQLSLYGYIIMSV